MHPPATQPPRATPADEGWTSWRAPGQSWRVRGERGAALVTSGPWPPSTWLASGAAEVVKEGSRRTVYRLDVPAGTVYLKRFHAANRLSRWRIWWRRAAQREAARAMALAARGIPTAEPLALGQVVARGGESDEFLVTAAIPGAVPVDRFLTSVLPRLPRQAQARVRRQIVRGLARLCGRLHEVGAWHDDLHLGNLLVRPDGDGLAIDHATVDAAAVDAEGVAEVFLIDLPGVRLGRSLTWRRARSNLVMLLSGARELSTRGERLRFWREYWAVRGESPPADERRALAELERQSRRHARRLLASREKRAWAENRDFQAVRVAGVRAHALAEVSPSALGAWASVPDVLLAQGWTAPLKLSHTSQVVRTSWQLGGGSTEVVVKRARPRRWWKRWLPSRFSPVARAWHWGHALLARGIATPRPLAVVLPRWGRRDGYLVTAYLPGAANLHEWLWRWADDDPALRRRPLDQAAASLGRLLGRLHRWRLSHGDLKGANLAFCLAGDRSEAYLLDADSVRRHWRLTRHERVANLVRLGTSLAEHPWLPATCVARFWQAYARETGLDRPGRHDLWRATAHATQREIARRRARGRAVL